MHWYNDFRLEVLAQARAWNLDPEVIRKLLRHYRKYEKYRITDWKTWGNLHEEVGRSLGVIDGGEGLNELGLHHPKEFKIISDVIRSLSELLNRMPSRDECLVAYKKIGDNHELLAEFATVIGEFSEVEGLNQKDLMDLWQMWLKTKEEAEWKAWVRDQEVNEVPLEKEDLQEPKEEMIAKMRTMLGKQGKLF